MLLLMDAVSSKEQLPGMSRGRNIKCGLVVVYTQFLNFRLMYRVPLLSVVSGFDHRHRCSMLDAFSNLLSRLRHFTIRNAKSIVVPYVSHKESELQSPIYNLAPNRVLRSRCTDFYRRFQSGGVDVTHLSPYIPRRAESHATNSHIEVFSPKYRLWYSKLVSSHFQVPFVPIPLTTSHHSAVP